MNSETKIQLLLKPADAARALSVCERTLETLRVKGIIPSVKLGGSRRYRVGDIEAALDSLQRGTEGASEVV